MAEGGLLLPFIAADLVPIVIEYARELKGNLVQRQDRSFDLMVAKAGSIFGTKFNSLSVQSGADERTVSTKREVRALLALKDGNIVVATALGIVQIFNGITLASEQSLVLPCEAVSAMAELSDDTLAIGTEEGTVAIVDTATKMCDLKKTMRAIGVTALLALPKAHFISGHSNGRLMEGSRRTSSRQFSSSHFLSVTALVAFGNKFASSSLDGTVRIWDSDSLLMQTVGFKYPLVSMCALHDGRLVIGGENQQVTVHDPDNYKCVLTLVPASGLPKWKSGPQRHFVVLDNNNLLVYNGEESCIFK